MNNLPGKEKSTNTNRFQEVLGFENNFIEFHIDPLHGPIGITKEEKEIISSDYFQRLKYIRQLGLVHHFYHSATHTRYEHSLGTLHTTWEMFKRIFSNFGTKNHSYSAKPEVLEKLADSTIIRALRIAGLCHDLGHGPFSHTFEIISGELCPDSKNHDEITYEILAQNQIKIPDDIHELVLAIINPNKNPLEGKQFSEFQFFLHDLVEGDIGSDRVDYLLRDTYMTGLGHRFGLNHLLEALTVIYDEKQERLYLSIEASEKYAVFYFLTTRFYHFQMIANYFENVALETKFKNEFIKYARKKQETRDIAEIVNDFQLKTDDEVRYIMKSCMNTDLIVYAKWTLFDVDYPPARFFAYRFSYDMQSRECYTNAIRKYVGSTSNLIFSFNIQKARIPIISVTLPSYTRERPPRKNGDCKKVEHMNSLLHEFSPLLYGLARSYLRNTMISVFGEVENKMLMTEMQSSPKFLFHSSVVHKTLEGCVDKIIQTNEKITYCNRLDFLFLFVAAMRKMPDELAMYKDDSRIILYRFRHLQYLIREVQNRVFSDKSKFPYKYGVESRYYNPERKTEEFIFNKTLFNDLFLLELFDILNIEVFSDDDSKHYPGEIHYYKTYMFIFKLSHIDAIIREYEKFDEYNNILSKIENALIQIGKKD